ncbi:cupin domain-containing protein [Chitinimonas koreensis]|uniref:cupin domain-containing protein n=1 Tax=Chitinimonas koreensis TaxID=356302 RepID=UPI0003FB403D|nr:cupin domain-containing protein [Chitinimonas koreensis]QNM98014.1 cupin domain-containing protein [Chitinimonas koreensis]
MPNPPLGNLTAEQFLADYWQKKPLLIRQAVTQFDWLPGLDELVALAGRDDVESRLVELRNGKWSCESGPFRPSRFKKLAASDWTVLVQNMNHHQAFCAELLYRFDFIPQVRLDDLMISYAPAGGGVGPHFDSYDVFLLQVGGRKRWRISSQDDLELVDGAPLKILERFVPEQEWELEHGDMLYLPPRYAHEGVALEAGMTWSVGFRAPTAQELGGAFLDYLRDRIELPGLYADPDLAAVSEPARLPDDFVARVAQMLNGIRWGEAEVRDFIGRYFSEPKAHVFYDSPDDELDEDDFAAAVARHGVALDLKSAMLFDGDRVYINGDTLDAEPAALPALRELANRRRLPPADYPAEAVEALYACYEYGYLAPGGE